MPKVSLLPELNEQLVNGDRAIVVHAGDTMQWDPYDYLVKNSGDETVTGVKTFSSSPVVPAASTSTQAVNMGQLDSVQNLATPLSDLSRVMRINGDGVPMFPDNVAGTVYKRVNNFSQTDIMTTNGPPTDGKIGFYENGEYLASRLSIYNGTVKIVAETNNNILRLAISAISKQVRFVIVPASDTTLFVNNDGPVVSTPEVKQGALNWIDITFNETGAGFIDIERLPVGNNYICGLYIGSGLYDTPVYGKDGQVVAVNHGVVPVNGKRGKALLFQGAQYLESPDKLGTSGVIAFKYKRKTIGVNEHICSCENFTSHKGVGVYISGGQYLVFIYGNGIADTNHAVIFDIAAGEEHSYVVNYTETTVGPVYRDGVLVYSQTALSGGILVSDTPTYIGRPTWGMADMLNGQLDDILVRSTPMTQDDAIRYHNGDDAVDSQQKSVTPTPHALMCRDNEGMTYQAYLTKTGSSTGLIGAMCFDASYLYICTAVNTWKRVALTTF